MLSIPLRAEINEHTSKLIVGLIAITLAGATSLFSDTPLQSISASYHEGGWSRDIFVGSLFAIAAFLLSYNGKPPYQTYQMVMSKIGALAAMCVAMFPCKCVIYDEIIPHVHAISAAVMFLILAAFCYFFFIRAWDKGHGRARLRAYIYAICGINIVASILIIAIDNILGGAISSHICRLTYYGETTALVSFGIAWLSASQTLPLLTSEDERISLFKYEKPRQPVG